MCEYSCFTGFYCVPDFFLLFANKILSETLCSCVIMSDTASVPSSAHSKRDQARQFASRDPVNPGDPPKRVPRKNKDVAPSSSSQGREGCCRLL